MMDKKLVFIGFIKAVGWYKFKSANTLFNTLYGAGVVYLGIYSCWLKATRCSGRLFHNIRVCLAPDWWTQFNRFNLNQSQCSQLPESKVFIVLLYFVKIEFNSQYFERPMFANTTLQAKARSGTIQC